MKLRIQEICKQRGLRMSDLAVKMGVNQANLASSLKGNPTVARLEAVAKVLGVPVADLFAKPSNVSTGVCGYLEYSGNIKKISSVEELIKAESWSHPWNVWMIVYPERMNGLVGEKIGECAYLIGTQYCRLSHNLH